MAFEVQTLTQDELPCLWAIDRGEHIANIYRLQDGELVLEARDFDVPGWPPGHEESTAPRLREALQRGGFAWAVIEGGNVVAGSVVDVKRVGVTHDLIQLAWLHVSRDYRGRALGRMLIEKAQDVARECGAAGRYISATPSENTVNFYRGCGAKLITAPDPELFALEPEDIHLEWRA